MEKEEKILVMGLCNSAIAKAEKFILKCESGKAKSVETLNDLKELKEESEFVLRQFSKIKT